jgi:hypothetical protein
MLWMWIIDLTDLFYDVGSRNQLSPSAGRHRNKAGANALNMSV